MFADAYLVERFWSTSANPATLTCCVFRCHCPSPPSFRNTNYVLYYPFDPADANVRSRFSMAFGPIGDEQ
jgi:hypothetical protein